MAVTQSPVYKEVYQFLLSSPTPQEVISFKASAATQERASALLEANRQDPLQDQEKAELDEFEQVNHFVSMLKIYARHNA